MNFIRAIFKWIDRITAWIAVLSLVLMFFFVFLNVVTRYILGTGFAWSEEGARYAMMAVIILGVLEVTHQRDHFAVDLLTNVAPKPVRRLMNIFADIMMLVIMYVMTFGSYQMVVLNWENRTPGHWAALLASLWTAIVFQRHKHPGTCCCSYCLIWG